MKSLTVECIEEVVFTLKDGQDNFCFCHYVLLVPTMQHVCIFKMPLVYCNLYTTPNRPQLKTIILLEFGMQQALHIAHLSFVLRSPNLTMGVLMPQLCLIVAAALCLCRGKCIYCYGGASKRDGRKGWKERNLLIFRHLLRRTIKKFPPQNYTN